MSWNDLQMLKKQLQGQRPARTHSAPKSDAQQAPQTTAPQRPAEPDFGGLLELQPGLEAANQPAQVNLAMSHLTMQQSCKPSRCTAALPLPLLFRMTADPCAAVSEHGARSLCGQQPVAACPTAAASRLACPTEATRPTSSVAAKRPAAAANKPFQSRQQRLAWAARLCTGRLPWLRVWGLQPRLQLWPKLWAGVQPGAAAAAVWSGM